MRVRVGVVAGLAVEGEDDRGNDQDGAGYLVGGEGFAEDGDTEYRA